MVFPKTNPVGVDRYIEALAAMLNDVLSAEGVWNMVPADYLCHGRAYRNQKEKGYVPEVYTGDGEFMDVTLEDYVKANSFWFVTENTPINAASAYHTATISVIFFVNLQAVKPTITHRADEEVRNDVERALRSYNLGQQMVRQITGIGNVFKEFDGWKTVQGEKYRDMYPYHCFRFDMTINYPPLNCNTF